MKRAISKIERNHKMTTSENKEPLKTNDLIDKKTGKKKILIKKKEVNIKK